jgi:aspartyl-tRNA(Asn)/glutamyl-tRNA(Gln) amidotransferase subunit B
MRSKEDAHDYRYFPDPDLLPIAISQELIDAVTRQLPELPAAKLQRFQVQYGLGDQDAASLSQDRAIANFFEATVANTSGDAKICANWITGELFAALNRSGLALESSPISPVDLGALVQRIADDTVSGKIAKQIFEIMWNTGDQPDAIIAAQGLRQVTDDGAIETLVEQVLDANVGQIEQYKAGKEKVFGFFVGQVMKLSKGKASPRQVNDLLKKHLENR